MFRRLSLSGQHHIVTGCQEQPAGVQDEDSESAQKLAEIERLRQAEKFMVVGTGEATCMGCGYEYSPKNGDPEYPITPGTYFTVRSASDAGCLLQSRLCGLNLPVMIATSQGASNTGEHCPLRIDLSWKKAE